MVYIVSFPFEQIGAILRVMSLSGAMGNVMAILFFGIICLIPTGFFFYFKKTGTFCQTDYMLYLISGSLFLYLYYMINPGLFLVPIPGSSAVYLGGVFYSILFAYLILRVLEKSKHADRDEILHMLPKLLYALGILFAAAIVIELVISLPEALGQIGVWSTLLEEQAVMEQIGSSDTVLTGMDDYFALPLSGGGDHLFTTCLFLILQSGIRIFPYLLDIWVIYLGLQVLKAWEEDWYCEQAIQLTEKLASSCASFLRFVVFTNMGFNMMQFLFRNYLYRTNMVISIPIDSLIFILLVLLVTRYMRASQKLKEENELFI